MDNREVEKILKKDAKKIKIKNFSEVWKKINNDNASESKEKRKKFTIWIPVFSSVLCVVIALAIIIPTFFINNSETLYYSDTLNYLATDEITFNTSINKDMPNCINFDKFDGASWMVYETSEKVAKGGKIDIYDNLESPGFYALVKFYDKNVEVKDIFFEYTENTIINNTTISYGLKEAYPDNSLYIYQVYAIYKEIQYYIELTIFSEDPNPFFTEFFN